jgi:hypothetical protein
LTESLITHVVRDFVVCLRCPASKRNSNSFHAKARSGSARDRTAHRTEGTESTEGKTGER